MPAIASTEKLSRRLASDFTNTIQGRGAAYYRRGDVEILHGSDTRVEALVYGSQIYNVEITWQNGDLFLFCDCLHYNSSGACKHLWATLLAVDDQNYLRAIPAGEELLPMYEPLEDEEDAPKILPPPAPKRAPEPAWRQRLVAIGDSRSQAVRPGEAWPPARQIQYVVDAAATLNTSGVVLTLLTREPKKDGNWSKPKDLRWLREAIGELPNPADREILALLVGGKQYYFGWGGGYEQLPSQYQLLSPLAGIVMPLLCRTERCYLRLKDEQELAPVRWDEGGPWQFALEVRRGKPGRWVVHGVLRRGEERMDLAVPLLITESGLVFTRERVAPLEPHTPFEWIAHLRKSGPLEAPEEDAQELLASLATDRRTPALDLPQDLRYEEVQGKLRACLSVRSVPARNWQPERLHGKLSFDYGERRVPELDRSRGFWDEGRRFVLRDLDGEAAAEQYLVQLGFRCPVPPPGDGPVWELPPKKLPGVARALLEAGWHVEAEGKTFRRPGAFRMGISSGVDWFELRGEVNYGETSAQLPELLKALKRGDKMVLLDDGTYGMLPEEWLARFGRLAGLGTSDQDHVRFQRCQAGLLDALLAAEPEIRYDESFSQAREELKRFEGVRAAEQPAGFAGRLRDYQREGLGWMQFLRQFGFGGCLADDMGVGKTAQVLALLETRRELGAAENGDGGARPASPSLVVVPKSLVFNWKLEAARFTPALRVLDYTGAARGEKSFDDFDLVLTTYGTLRRDALRFKDAPFDYVILDEAQCVKNATTETAKAVRLLKGRHRLALSGTPVENHLGELWSLFEFLNPGMLGAASVFKLAGGTARNPDEETRRLLAHALRPFILRRTKAQVAPELPAKVEQTIHCVMEPEQRKLYNELRVHYRNSLLRRIEQEGMAKAKIQVLEALLRLRQAACHPGLIDHKRSAEPSAKIEVLLDHLAEVLEEGHKALVYSQFTSFLRIVRDRLDARGIEYEYLDGSTSDRQTPVERFQNDPNRRLFLISLKAGGLGLNLTAAEYVFLLDPWWNPAVEAQAVDRAHRIGQDQQVFAYRLIARDTVEEKVLELQNKKRDLAESIISADSSVMRDLRREDLEMLLS